MKYTCTIPCFDLEQTALSGQCFRLMPGKEPGLPPIKRPPDSAAAQIQCLILIHILLPYTFK